MPKRVTAKRPQFKPQKRNQSREEVLAATNLRNAKRRKIEKALKAKAQKAMEKARKETPAELKRQALAELKAELSNPTLKPKLFYTVTEFAVKLGVDPRRLREVIDAKAERLEIDIWLWRGQTRLLTQAIINKHLWELVPPDESQSANAMNERFRALVDQLPRLVEESTAWDGFVKLFEQLSARVMELEKRK